jgi:uncharacterized protein (TIGR00255 family)
VSGGPVTSMTGFGRGVCEADGFTVQAEAKSFNQRFLKVISRLPSELGFLEEEIRKRVTNMASRGQVEVTVKLSGNIPGGTYRLNSEALRAHYTEWLKANEDLGLEVSVPVESLLRIPDIWVEGVPDEKALEAVSELVITAVDGALELLDKMRKQEGEATRKDLHGIGDGLHEIVKAIEKLWPEARMCAVEKLRPVVAELLACEDGCVPAGVERELVQLADRSDISEELKRLESHLTQYLASLEEGGDVGRRLEFLLQEMHRELNTIASKSLDARISSHVVEAKVLMERGREQVQNIE